MLNDITVMVISDRRVILMDSTVWKILVGWKYAAEPSWFREYYTVFATKLIFTS